ncbi:MAG: ABC transporter permease [Deltaproteobacteria bacterium]|nr:ABC transporter permease [Deltaproteobacteria bacterium]
MKPRTRAFLTLAGWALLLLLWQVIVSLTRPAALQRVALAFSTPRDGSVCVVVLGTVGEMMLQEPLSLEIPAAESEGLRLRAWIKASQPTVVGMPPEAPGGDTLKSMLQTVRQEFGGGLEPVEVSLPSGTDSCAEARRRAAMTQSARAIRAAWLPDPWEASRALIEMAANGELLRHIVASVFRVAAGVGLALALGIPFGLAFGSFAWLSAPANAVIQVLRPISPIAWLPVATLAFGGGDLAAVFLIFLAAFFPVTVSTAAAVTSVDLKYRRTAINFGVRGIDLARRVILPAALPSILTAVRISVGIAWVVVVAAEMLGVESGLGYLVLDARNQLRYDRVVAAMMTIGAIGFLIDAAVRYVERIELERRGLAGHG